MRLRDLLTGVALAALAAVPAQAQKILRDGFAGRQTAWQRGEDTVRGRETAHELSDRHAHNGPTSEHIQVVAPASPADPARIEYFYPTPPAPVTAEFAAGVWVKANRSGVQFGARVVLPRERNPERPTEPLTDFLPGDRYQLRGSWQRLELPRPAQLLRDRQQALRIRLGRDVDITGAYVDRLILNLYTGPGQTDVFIDDLEIGPVPDVRRPAPPPPAPESGTGRAASQGPPDGPDRPDRGHPVRLEAGRLQIAGVPFFFRAIRHSSTPLKALRDAGFNTVWFDADTDPETIDEAVANGFWIVPSLPLLGDDSVPVGTGGEGAAPGAFASARTPEGLVAAVNRFASADGVLFWDLGGGRSAEQLELVSRTARAVRTADPHRPRGVDVWDGLQAYSLNSDLLLGTHRWPLMSSLELSRYRDWLDQRRRLAAPGTFMWTWIQTHIPEGQARLLYGDDLRDGADEPVGPQPEQIRLLTYLALAAGCKGLGFWSDRFLADSHHGRDRLLALALLNQEIEMLEPILLRVGDAPVWIDTSHPDVKAAVMRCDKGVLVLPVWLGGGMQYVPGQAAVRNLTLTVPQVPNGAQPWEISPGFVRSLLGSAKRVPGGVQVAIPEFDLTTAIVFTGDLTPNGLVVHWQDHSRRKARLASQYAMDLAAVQLEKVRAVHTRLAQLAPPVPDAEELLADAERRLARAQVASANRDDREAYREATRARRPLRILMRAHWEQAVRHLDIPTASPYAVSFYTLPRHWELFRRMQSASAGLTVLRGGGFEAHPNPGVTPVSLRRTAGDGEGADVSALPGWQVVQGTLDEVTTEARLVPSAALKDPEPGPAPPPLRPDRYAPSSTDRLGDPDLARPRPELGTSCLRLRVAPKVRRTEAGKPLPPPAVLERTYLAVRSPWVRLPPGTLVRVSGWVKIPAPITASADGVLMFDSVGGEALGVRLAEPTYVTTGGRTVVGWKRFNLYREVPESGAISVTLMLTGIGEVYFDDLKIEPLTNK